MKYTIDYPSGPKGIIDGQFQLVHLRQLLTPVINPLANEPDGIALVLDQRAIIKDETGKVVYHPREGYGVGLHPSIAEWLKEHPEWDSTN